MPSFVTKQKKYGNINLRGEHTNLSVKIKNFRGLTGSIEIPLSNQVYAITGSNGSGKSTLMSILAKLVPPYNFRLSKEDFVDDTEIVFNVYDYTNSWNFIRGTRKQEHNEILFEGKYEGSLFYGNRFEDSNKVEYAMSNGFITDDLLVEANEYIKQTLGKILQGDKDYYKNLKRLKERKIIFDDNPHSSKNIWFKNYPYFNKINNNLISQFKMSSGECLLLTLLHFLYNAIINKSIDVKRHILLLIDEIELALHPVAVKRFIEVLQKITEDSKNLTCVITSHSLEVIRSIPPNNIFNLNVEIDEDRNRSFIVDNPIYPCYLMRDIYSHNGYDYVILVEDKLASKVVENSLLRLGLRTNKLINVVPIGGWRNVATLHKGFMDENTLGINTKIISVIDGDVESEANAKFKNLKHTFLPISSVEKFILKYLTKNENVIKKEIKDIIFTGTKSIEEFIEEYYEDERRRLNDPENKPDKNGKRIYGRFKHYCEEHRKISEDRMIDILYDIASRNINFSEFEQLITELIN